MDKTFHMSGLVGTSVLWLMLSNLIPKVNETNKLLNLIMYFSLSVDEFDKFKKGVNLTFWNPQVINEKLMSTIRGVITQSCEFYIPFRVEIQDKKVRTYN